MARKFTKYPQGYVKASRGSSGKRLGYGVEYRNMHTAIHGIFWSYDKKTASVIENICSDLEDAQDEHEYNALVNQLYSLDMEVIDEINYRDVTKDQKYYLDDGYIQIINLIAYDLYF